ncbi:MAG: Holliday junction branch migration protein RuvA [Clostridiaceae bacterium]|nr:Holliday junction branch migration protein RuvA [Clostridiaceae bacterium]
MYAYVKGTIENIKDSYVVVDVSGIGYKVHVPVSTIEKLPQREQFVKLYTYLHVREDAMDLYGFLDEEELYMFELLISVSGVGPKAALALLSTLAPSKFALAVAASDIKTITKAPGVGNKLAQRIILELKDKIKTEDLAGIREMKNMPLERLDHQSEAVSALVVLGYSFAEASAAVKAVHREGMEVEEIIRKALKQLLR